MTAPHDWDSLINRRVTVTNPDNPEGTWTGKLTGLYSEPVLILELDDGTRRPLPQRFTIVLAPATTENTEDEDEGPPEIVRAKWSIDGAATLEEAARMSEAFAAELRQLAADGMELEAPVENDYGYLVPAESGPRGDPGTRGDLAAGEDLRWQLVSAVAGLLAAADYGNMGDLEMPPGMQQARRELCVLLGVTRNDVPRHAIEMMLYAALYPGSVQVADLKADPGHIPVPDGALLVLQPGDMITISWSGELRTVTCDRVLPGGAVLRDLPEAEEDALETSHASIENFRASTPLRDQILFWLPADVAMGWTLTAIAQQTGQPRAAVHQKLNALQAEGLIAQRVSGRKVTWYRVTGELGPE